MGVCVHVFMWNDCENFCECEHVQCPCPRKGVENNAKSRLENECQTKQAKIDELTQNIHDIIQLLQAKDEEVFAFTAFAHTLTFCLLRSF